MSKEITGADITAWREQKNIGLREFAILIDASHSSVNRWENGQEIPGPAKKLVALLIHGTAPFASGKDSAGDDLTNQNLLPNKLTFEDWEALAEDARAGGFRNVRDYVQHWLKAKAAEVRKTKG